MSALIHKTSAAQFKAMSPKARLEYLSTVGSEFVGFTGRGRNRKLDWTMPESYRRLFDRRVRQAAALAEQPLEKVQAQVFAAATAKAEKAKAAAEA